MKPISKKAARVLWFITAGLNEENSHRKIDAGNGYMPVVVEFLYHSPNGDVFSVAHYYTQNGDAMRDPEITFIRSTIDDHAFFPASYLQDNLGIYQEHFTYDNGGKITGVYKRQQRDCATFCTTWMENIKHQQNLPI